VVKAYIEKRGADPEELLEKELAPLTGDTT
jgi:hypothetical protein